MIVEPSDATMRLMAARSARRVISNELHQQQQQQHSNNERELEKEIAALKCFVSKPGALDKVIINWGENLCKGCLGAESFWGLAKNFLTKH